MSDKRPSRSPHSVKNAAPSSSGGSRVSRHASPVDERDLHAHVWHLILYLDDLLASPKTFDRSVLKTKMTQIETLLRRAEGYTYGIRPEAAVKKTKDTKDTKDTSQPSRAPTRKRHHIP